MFSKFHRSVIVKLGCLLVGTLSLKLSFGQVSFDAKAVVTRRLDERVRTRLTGNTPAEANATNDRGLVSLNTRFEHLLLQLRRPPEKQRALEQFLSELSDPSSPNFHQWLSSEEFGSRFGLAAEDLQAVSQWLESHGLKVNAVTPNLAVDFSGTAAQIQSAFHAPIHHLTVKGERHVANINDPDIPAALAPAVAGVVSLNDFKPRSLSHAAVPQFTTGSGRYPLVPADLGVIYNFNPAFAAGISGQGQTIAVLEDSNPSSTGDWLVFRKVFGLARRFPQGQVVLVHPQSSSGQTCSDPGINANAVESAIDAEWASAAAPNATILVASCRDTFISGALVALQNLLTGGGTPPGVVSISFGVPEAVLGTAQNAFVSSLYQMAVAEGVSVFVAAGDSGAAFADGTAPYAVRGISVNGFASTPYNVAVGGTDFGDGYAGTTSSFWSASNSPTYQSALSYVPEITWNGTCGSELLATSKGFATTYGAGGYCNNGGPLSLWAGSGGPSGCASGIPGRGGVVGNTCTGYAKPAWQSVFGNPADGVRDLPDVSLFGSNNVWGHYFVTCFSDTLYGGKPCLGTPDTWAGYGGTSITAPIMAGIQALINQKTGTRWGNPNPFYYRLAAAEYGSSGNAACDATGAGTGCSFHDVTTGDIAVPCFPGTNNCFSGSNPGANGVLSISTSDYQPAYRSNIGWDFATGLGSVDVWNLLNNWPTAVVPTGATQ